VEVEVEGKNAQIDYEKAHLIWFLISCFSLAFPLEGVLLEV
jgi:hypothetical protein